MAADNIRVDYDYITAHRNFWKDLVAPEIAAVMKLSREMELYCRHTVFFGEFIDLHNKMTDFVRDRSDEGHQAHHDIARVLAQIKAYYEANEEFNARLLQSGGHRP